MTCYIRQVSCCTIVTDSTVYWYFPGSSPGVIHEPDCERSNWCPANTPPAAPNATGVRTEFRRCKKLHTKFRQTCISTRRATPYAPKMKQPVFRKNVSPSEGLIKKLLDADSKILWDHPSAALRHLGSRRCLCWPSEIPSFGRRHLDAPFNRPDYPPIRAARPDNRAGPSIPLVNFWAWRKIVMHEDGDFV